MSTQGYPAPLTWERLLELAAQGHDHCDASLTSTRARQLVESVREHFAAQVGDVARRGEEDRQTLHATLSRVRAISRWNPCPAEPEEDDDGPLFQGFLTDPAGAWARTEELDAALAGQPESVARALCGGAPTRVFGQGYDDDCNGTKPEAPKGKGEWFAALKPEAPKGPAAEADPVKECANCGCVTHGHQMLCCESPLECGHRRRVEYWREACQKSERDLAAANARIVTLDRGLGDEIRAHHETRVRELAANARADAAELAVETWVATERDAYAGIETERDQLAARVTSMQAELDIAWADDDPKETCTPEERQVLNILRDAKIIRPPDCYPYLENPHEPAIAELANRAAKAKREAT